MAIMEITIIPKTSSISVSEKIADIIKYLENNNIKYTLTGMSTIIEDEIKKLFEIAREMHEISFIKGTQRVYTIIKIDDRRDKKSTINSKIKSVLEKM